MEALSGVQRFFSVTLIKELEKIEVSYNKIVWLNYPIYANYKFVEGKKIKKEFLKLIDDMSNKDQYLKLSEWNIECIGEKEANIQCLLWDQEFYFIIITLNGANDMLRLAIEKVKVVKFEKNMSVPCYREGDLLVDKKVSLKEFGLIDFELKTNKRFFLGIKRIKSISEKTKYSIEVIRDYLLWMDKDFEVSERYCFKKRSKIIVNMYTLYGPVRKLYFLSRRKICQKIIREKISKWAFECSRMPYPYTYRTVFYFIPEGKT